MSSSLSSRRRVAPAAERNRVPIAAALADRLPPGDVLEIASGSGTHAAFFGPRFAPRRWWPTDAHPDALTSIDGWRAHGGAGLAMIQPAERLDVTADRWPIEDRPADREALGAIFCANMIHIAPWSAAQGLMAGAGRVLSPGGRLFVYGPFRFDGVFTAPSNARFDASLRSRDPDWGVRDLTAVTAEARRHGLQRVDVVALPANNHLIEFAR